jgi:hypothetical protein
MWALARVDDRSRFRVARNDHHPKQQQAANPNGVTLIRIRQIHFDFPSADFQEAVLKSP